MYTCDEMIKLRIYLDERGIEWEDKSEDYGSFIGGEEDFWICRTHFCINSYHVSVINGYGTYGGFNSLHHIDNEGLLEIMSDLCKLAGWEDNPAGYKTAEDIIALIEQFLPKEKPSE